MNYLPPLKKKCLTCPFRPDGKTEFRELLIQRALTEATPICHSTGDSEVVPESKKVRRENRACRGARDLQILYMHAIGFLAEPTDKCWEAKVKEMEADGH